MGLFVDGGEVMSGSAAHSNYCAFDGHRLSRPFDPEPPGALCALVHDSFRALVLSDQFSCLGGRAAIRQNSYRFGLYDRLGSSDSAAALGRDLQRFSGDTSLTTKPLTAFVASFVEPNPHDETEFEELLWKTLQQLSAVDTTEWVEGRSDDPDDAGFAFSFGGAAFFIVGLHAGSSRMARRFAWPTIVFNPHEQFDLLRREGRYQRFQRLIRTADVALQGSINPMLSDFGEQSEARQYSGRSVGEEWRCPFHANVPSPARKEP